MIPLKMVLARMWWGIYTFVSNVTPIILRLSQGEEHMVLWFFRYFVLLASILYVHIYELTLLSVRYKLHLVVVDETKVITKLLLFDNHDVQLLRQQCIELAGPLLKDKVYRETIYLNIVLHNLVLIFIYILCIVDKGD